MPFISPNPKLIAQCIREPQVLRKLSKYSPNMGLNITQSEPQFRRQIRKTMEGPSPEKTSLPARSRLSGFFRKKKHRRGNLAGSAAAFEDKRYAGKCYQPDAPIV